MTNVDLHSTVGSALISVPIPRSLLITGFGTTLQNQGEMSGIMWYIMIIGYDLGLLTDALIEQQQSTLLEPTWLA